MGGCFCDGVSYHQFSFYLEYEIFPVRPSNLCVRMLPISLRCARVAFHAALAAQAVAMTQPKAWFLCWWAKAHGLPHPGGHLQRGRWYCLAGIWRTNCFLCQQRWQTRDCHCLALFSVYNIWGKAALCSYSCGSFCALVRPSNLTVLQHSILFDSFILS